MKMKLNHLFILLITLTFYSACKKETNYPELEKPADLTNIGVGEYLPLNFGSKWFYTQYSFSGGIKKALGRTTCRHDSIYNYFFFYDSITRNTSYGYWYRASDKWFYSGQGQKMLTDMYLDSIQNNPYTSDTIGNYRKFIIGGAAIINTKAGTFNCIKVVGKSKKTTTHWEQYFGKGAGLILTKDYYLNNNLDTIITDHKELDSYLIKK